jgi:hypothetical protein
MGERHGGARQRDYEGGILGHWDRPALHLSR